MPDLDYGKVIARLGLNVGDTSDDVDDNPDTVWCDSGRVFITPLNTFVKVAGGTPDPFTMGNAVIECGIDVDGYLTYDPPGAAAPTQFVWVADLTSDKVNPQLADGEATHRVVFSEVMAGTTRVEFPTVTVRITAAGDGISGAGINDLTILAPVLPGEASPIYRGEQGIGIADASIIGGTNLQLELTDGDLVDAGALPVGPGGSDPGVAGYFANPASATSVESGEAAIDTGHPLGAAIAGLIADIPTEAP